MALLTSKQMLRDYIMRKLGNPVIRIELTDDQLDDCIDDAIELYTLHAVSATDSRGMILPMVDGTATYNLTSAVIGIAEVRSSQSFSSQNITYTLPGGQLVTPTEFYAGMMGSNLQSSIENLIQIQAKIGSLRKFFDTIPNYTYNRHSGVIRFKDDTPETSNSVFLEVYLRYIPNDNNDLIWNNSIIRKLSSALAKRQWGENIGKYDGELIGGKRVNYDRIIGEAQTVIDECNEEIKQISGPFPILVG